MWRFYVWLLLEKLTVKVKLDLPTNQCTFSKLNIFSRYSFAIVGINLTHMAYRLLNDGSAKTHVFSSTCDPERSSDLSHFHYLYCYLFVEFDKVSRNIFIIQGKKGQFNNFFSFGWVRSHEMSWSLTGFIQVKYSKNWQLYHLYET